MALSIKYHHADAYTLPKKYLDYFLNDTSLGNLVVNIRPDSTSVNTGSIIFMTSSKYEKKIAWDVIKAMHLYVTMFNEYSDVKSIPSTIKQAIVDGLYSVNNTLAEGRNKKEIYKKFLEFVCTSGIGYPVKIHVLDIVETSQISDYRILIPCEILS